MLAPALTPEDTTNRAAGSQKQRRVLIVSPYFPPSTLAGVHRARHLAKHLSSVGWSPVVLCVDEAFHEHPLDPALAAFVPSSVEIVKVPAIPLRYTRPFGIGEISLRAWSTLRRTTLELLAKRRFDVVLITGGPFYPMLLASEIKRRSKAAVVLDFQDPWVSQWGGQQSILGKAGLAHLLATCLEPRALKAADAITSVSHIQNEEIVQRYAWLAHAQMAAIPIGGDPEDFDALRAQPPARPTVRLDPAYINLSYVGTFLPRAGPVVRCLFDALRTLRKSAPDLAQRLRLNFIGTSNQPGALSAPCILPIARELGVENMVWEHPGRVPYLEALSILASSNGLLLMGSDEPHYTASKIYPALMSGRPFLSLFHEASSAHAILRSAGGGIARAFTDRASLSSLVPSMADDLFQLATQPQALGTADTQSYQSYTAHAVSEAFAQVFEAVAR